MISRKYLLLTFLLFLFFKNAYPMESHDFQQVYLGPSQERIGSSSALSVQYTLGNSTCSLSFDYKNAPSGSLSLQLAEQDESIKTIHSLVHDISSLQQNPIGFRNSILFEQEMALFCGDNIYSHETIQPCKDETVPLDGFHVHVQPNSPRENLNDALKQITRFSIKHDTAYNSIFDCTTELSHNDKYMTKVILARYNLDIDQAKEVFEYVKQYKIAIIDIALEEIERLQSFSAREFQAQINKYSPTEIIKIKQDFNRDLQRVINNYQGENKDFTSYEQDNRRDFEDVAYRPLSRKILEYCNLWQGDYREDYYTRIAKRDQKISELKSDMQVNKTQQELIIEKIKIIEEVEKNISYSYKQELLNNSSDGLRLMLDHKHKIIKIIEADEESHITQELIDAHKLEYDCIKEAFTEKRTAEYIALLHEQYGDDIHTYAEINITENPNLIIQERYGALQQARDNNFETSFCNFQLNDQGRNFLDKKGIDFNLFEHIEGNAFAGQLCKEQCAIINQVGQLHEVLRQSPHYIKAPRLSNLLQTPKEELANTIQSSEQFVDCCLELTTDSTVLANQALHAGNLEQAVKLNDYSQAIIEHFEQMITICECNKQFALGFLIDGPKNAVTNIYQLGTDICHIVSEIASNPTKAIPHYVDKAMEYQINKSREHEEAIAELIADVAFHSDRPGTAAMLMQCGYLDKASEIFEEEAKYLDQQTPQKLARMRGAFISEEIINTGIKLLVGKSCRLARIGGIRAKQFLKRSPDPKLLMRTPEGQVVKTTKNAFKKAGKLENYQKFSREVSDFYAKGRKTKSKIKGIKGLIKNEKLPTKGKIRFVPPKNTRISEGLKKVQTTRNGKRFAGFEDRFKNIWTKGDSRTAGQGKEWDVQLSPIGKRQLGWMTRDNTHLNVSMDGRVTHK